MVSLLKTELYTINLRFEIDDSIDPPRAVIHEALEALRGFDIEATSIEQAEHYGDVIRRALEVAGS
jgi:hypothetical protein